MRAKRGEQVLKAFSGQDGRVVEWLLQYKFRPASFWQYISLRGRTFVSTSLRKQSSGDPIQFPQKLSGLRRLQRFRCRGRPILARKFGGRIGLVVQAQDRADVFREVAMSMFNIHFPNNQSVSRIHADIVKV
jgi:hypothetical protein